MGWLADRIPYFRGDEYVVTPLRCLGCASVVGHVGGQRVVCMRCGHADSFRATVRITRYEKLLLYLGVR